MPRQSILAFGILALALACGPAGRPAHAEEPRAPEAHAGAADAGTAAPHATHAGTEEGESPNLLEPQPALAIWTLVVFLGLLFVLGRYAWKPLIAALDRREEHLEHVLLETERARTESEQLLAEHRRQMEEAEDRARALIEKARAEGRAAFEEILHRARTEADAEIRRARNDIESARDQALGEVWSKAAELAVSVAGKVLSRDLGHEDHRRLIAAATSELPAAPAHGNGSPVA